MVRNKFSLKIRILKSFLIFSCENIIVLFFPHGFNQNICRNSHWTFVNRRRSIFFSNGFTHIFTLYKIERFISIYPRRKTSITIKIKKRCLIFSWPTTIWPLVWIIIILPKLFELSFSHFIKTIFKMIGGKV